MAEDMDFSWLGVFLVFVCCGIPIVGFFVFFICFPFLYLKLFCASGSKKANSLYIVYGLLILAIVSFLCFGGTDKKYLVQADAVIEVLIFTFILSACIFAIYYLIVNYLILRPLKKHKTAPLTILCIISIIFDLLFLIPLIYCISLITNFIPGFCILTLSGCIIAGLLIFVEFIMFKKMKKMVQLNSENPSVDCVPKSDQQNNVTQSENDVNQ